MSSDTPQNFFYFINPSLRQGSMNPSEKACVCMYLLIVASYFGDHIFCYGKRLPGLYILNWPIIHPIDMPTAQINNQYKMYMHMFSNRMLQ